MCNPKSFSGFTIYTVEKKEEKGREGEEEAGRERNKGRGSPRARDEGFFTNWDIAGKGLLGTLYGTFSKFSYYINLTHYPNITFFYI